MDGRRELLANAIREHAKCPRCGGQGGLPMPVELDRCHECDGVGLARWAQEALRSVGEEP